MGSPSVSRILYRARPVHGCVRCRSGLLPAWLAVLGIAAFLLLAPSRPAAAVATDTQNLPLEKLVFVTEDIALPGPGCDAISAFSVESPAPLYQGPTHTSPSRLAATTDLSTILAVQCHGGPFLYALRPPLDGGGLWDVDPDIRGGRFSGCAGIAIMPDNETVLVGSNGSPRSVGAPYWVAKYRLSDMRPGRVGPELGRFEVESHVAEILPDPDATRAHVLTKDAQVHTFDTSTMTAAADPIHLRPIGESTFPPEQPVAYLFQTHATITADGRYLLSNRFDVPELNVADLVSRRSWAAETGNPYNGGLVINRGWVNTGLLALHAVDSLVVYRFDPPSGLVELSRLPVERPYEAMFSGTGGPQLAIAWSGSGSSVVAATDHAESEFVVAKVEDEGRRLVRLFHAAVCHTQAAPGQFGRNLPGDILTANGLLTPPTRTPSPAPTTTTTPASSPTSTATPRPTVTTTQPPRKIYLPLVIGEECIPDRMRVDVALVIDASTSMLLRTHAGRTKLAAALEALRLFTLHLHLPQDQAAIVEFNGGVRLLQSLTGSRAALDAALSRVEVRRQTRIDLGIELAHDELMSSRRLRGNDPVMIVLTDGKANPVPASVAVQNAERAKKDGIIIFTIGLGDELDLWALEEMASKSEYFYRAPDAEDLKDIYAEIAVEIPCPADDFWGNRP